MSAEYSRDMLKVSVAKMLQTLGWHSVNTTPVEIMTDMLRSYLCNLGKLTNEYANQYNCTEPNLDHLGLAFREMNVDLGDLEEYIKYVDFGQNPTPVPKYPIPKEDHLNFLKPGSKEVLTRPVHIHEHLPPMSFGTEGDENASDIKTNQEESEDMAVEAPPVFKRPIDVSPSEGLGFTKRARFAFEEEGRPTREISSVMMTTSGYLSPAREGKLPESRTPLAAVDPVIPSNPVNALPDTPLVNNSRKPSKLVKKVDRKNKEKIGKELFKPDEPNPVKTKKPPPMKDVAKLKQAKQQPSHSPLPQTWNNMLANNDVKPPTVQTSPQSNKSHNNKINKALQAARLKTEKLNTTITPIPAKSIPDNVDKLLTEPDKKKVNIFKKISNVKNEKANDKMMKIKEEIKPESRESSPDLVIDESASDSVNRLHKIPSDITIELIDAPKVPEKLEARNYFDDDSPPGTPSTPKTPEMISQSPPLTKEKGRKQKKDRAKVKKVNKHNVPSPDVMDAFIDLERPKTPEAAAMMKPDIIPPMPFPFFQGFNPAPGLIPNNPMFPHIPMAMPAFGQPPFMPTVPMFMQPVKAEMPEEVPKPQPSVHKPVVEKPAGLPPPSSPAVASSPVPSLLEESSSPTPKSEKKSKEHKKEKKDKIKKKNKKDKSKDKAEKKKLKEEKKDKEKIKKEKKEKRKEKEQRENIEIAVPKITLKLGSASPLPQETPERKLNIKPVVKKEEEEVKVDVKREMSPELAKISALVTGQPKSKSVAPPIPPIKDEPKEESVVVVSPTTKPGPGPGRPRIHPVKPKPAKPNNKRQLPVKDSEGNEVWICPACGQQDDGSPMIGCDDCDAWYHWFCVGIQVPPDDNENWYCRHCIAKKQEVLQSDKKKKRKKKEKKEH